MSSLSSSAARLAPPLSSSVHTTAQIVVHAFPWCVAIARNFRHDQFGRGGVRARRAGAKKAPRAAEKYSSFMANKVCRH